MKKKLISALLCAAMVSEFLAGCSSKSEDEGKEKVSMWVPPLDDSVEENWAPLLEKFEKENNCEIDMEVLPWENYKEKWATGAASQDLPDIGYMYAEMFPTYIDSGAVTDMSEYITEEDKEEYLYLDHGYMMDGQYGFPIVTGVPFVLYYNEDILNELGEQPPETWADFKRICEKATKDTDGDGKIDQYGYTVGFNNGSMNMLYLLNAYFYSFLWQSGTDIYNDDLKSVKFNDEMGVEAAEFFLSLKPYMPENFMTIAAEDAFSTIFGQGKAAFGVTRSASIQERVFKESYPNLNWNYVTSLKNKDYGTFGATDCLALSSQAENPELCMKLIKYITGSEFMTEYHKVAPGAPLTKSEPYQGDEKMERIITEDYDKYRPLQVGPCGSDILTNLASELQGMMEGKKDAKAAMDDAAKYADAALEKYWADKE
nr:sugar ABC transporter substrate-binding protein [uncultured Sellimonas sp.]